jgi:hypothetical protein
MQNTLSITDYHVKIHTHDPQQFRLCMELTLREEYRLLRLAFNYDSQFYNFFL